jgi:hypothetical protein
MKSQGGGGANPTVGANPGFTNQPFPLMQFSDGGFPWSEPPG